MKKNIKRIYIIEAILLIFIVIFKFLIMDNNLKYYEYINLGFWIILFISLIIMGGFPKDKNYLKKSTTKTVVIMLLLYTLVLYILGLFTGYAKSIHSHSLFGMLKNIVPIILYVDLVELCRYLIFRKNPNKLQVVIFTVLIISLNMIMTINNMTLNNHEMIFLVTSVIILPIIAREALYSYITYNVSPLPTILISLALNLWGYVIPILPNLGNYITAVTGVVFPYLVYKQVSKNITYKEKYNMYAKKYLRNFVFSFILIFTLIITALVSGIFKYHMIAIMSDSMNPVYYRGDAIIYYKERVEKINEGDILVFKSGNSIITHRVVSKVNDNGHYTFRTKGDNNNTEDKIKITEKDVLGTVKYIVKYIGYPTVWFNS